MGLTEFSYRQGRDTAAAEHICKRDHVLEIGPGKGHITRELIGRCGRLTAVELDHSLWARLGERFAGDGRLTLIEGNFLKTPLPKGPYKVFANIPFSETSNIIRRLTQCGNPPGAAWLIVEWGAAKRFAGNSLAGWTLRPYFKVRAAARIGRGQFHPAPSVDAALLELRRREAPTCPGSSKGSSGPFWSGPSGRAQGPC